MPHHQPLTLRDVEDSPRPEVELGDWFRQPADSPEASAAASLEAVERAHILKVLDLTGWRVSGERGAARILGLKPTTLHARMAKLDIRRNGWVARNIS
jgi:transcriptional regulator with GAF, ATPase, and Fis domain